MKKLTSLITITILFVHLSGAVMVCQTQKETMTNESVIELVKLGLGEAVIIQKIRQSERRFDTSTAGLAQLKAAKVSDNVIMEMMNSGDSGSTPAGPPSSNNIPRQPSITDPSGLTPPPIANVTGSGGVILVDGDKRIEMKYSAPEMRSNSMLGGVVNPFHKSRIRSALKGNHASLRTSNNSPLFEVSLERDAHPTDLVAVVKLEAKSETREIETSRGGITGISTGFRKEDLIPIAIEEVSDAKSQNNKLYRIKMVNPLRPGEYALVYRGGAYYDFGVDGVK